MLTALEGVGTRGQKPPPWFDARLSLKGRGQSSTQYPPIRRTISRALKPKMKVPPSSASSFLDEAIGSRAAPMISDAKNIKGFCNSK